MPQIVVVNVSQQVAPFPNNLQKTGAVISQGGTNTAAGTVSQITELADATPLYAGTLAISSITWASGVATVTTTAVHGFQNATTIPVTIAGTTPAGYSGSFNATITGTSTLTYPLSVNPGTSPATVPGMYTEQDVAELCAMLTTFFAQGNSQSVFILELGANTPAAGVASLTAFMIASANAPQPLPGQNLLPSRFYAYLVPRSWAAESTFQALVQSYESPTAMQYFYVTSTVGNYTGFNALQKDVLQFIEAPTVDKTTEFSAAAAFRVMLNYAPGATNRVPPYSFSYVYGVTPYPTFGNSALLTTLKTQGVNIIGTGAEGGISNTILLYGTSRDTRDFNYWYSVDWVQIQLKLAVANAIINGSNNPINPLYYNQAGINRLQAVIASVMARGVTFGLVLGTPVQTQLDGPELDASLDAGLYQNQTVVNAIPFIPYSIENPGDYKIGLYSGFSVIFVPQRGFDQIVINVVASDFVTA